MAVCTNSPSASVTGPASEAAEFIGFRVASVLRQRRRESFSAWERTPLACLPGQTGQTRRGGDGIEIQIARNHQTHIICIERFQPDAERVSRNFLNLVLVEKIAQHQQPIECRSITGAGAVPI